MLKPAPILDRFSRVPARVRPKLNLVAFENEIKARVVGVGYLYAEALQSPARVRHANRLQRLFAFLVEAIAHFLNVLSCCLILSRFRTRCA